MPTVKVHRCFNNAMESYIKKKKKMKKNFYGDDEITNSQRFTHNYKKNNKITSFFL